EDPGHDSGAGRSGDHSPEDVRAEAGEGEAEDPEDVRRGDRTGAEPAQRRGEDGDAAEVLGECERVVIRIEDRRVEEARAEMRGGVDVPVEIAGVEVRIA